MKSIFDGVRINQILLQADTVNRVAWYFLLLFFPLEEAPRPGASNDLLNRVKKKEGWGGRYLLDGF